MELSVQGREVCLEAFRYLENVTVYQLKVIRYYRQTQKVRYPFFGRQYFSLQKMSSTNFDTAWQCCGSGRTCHLMRIRIRILPFTLLRFRVRIRILPFTLLRFRIRIRVLASKKRLKTMKNFLLMVIFHTFWLVICKLMHIRIRIQLITLMRIRIRILPFYLMRIRIHNTAAWALKKQFSTGFEVTTTKTLTHRRIY